MKKFLFVVMILLAGFSLSACANHLDSAAVPSTSFDQAHEVVAEQSDFSDQTRIKLTVNHQEVVIRLYDHPVSRDLLTLLPLTLTFKDYVNEEKISYLPRELVREEVQGNSGRRDDFTYFAPWGNLAIFYNGKQQGSNGLIILGTIENQERKSFPDWTLTLLASLKG